MNWVVYALFAILVVGVSDIFRKIASTIKSPFEANLYFQWGGAISALILFLLFSRKMTADPKTALTSFTGGSLIAIFTLFSFKALSMGPSASVVMPVLRIGGISFLVLLSIIFLKERLNFQMLVGLLFSFIGIYLLFSNK